MTKRRGAASDNGFILKKIKYKREENVLWAVFEIIPFIYFYPLG
jgi:hypothetical protein